MAVAIVTGSAGLIGSEAAAYYADLGFDVIGIDNDMRRVFFGDDASTSWNRRRLTATLGKRYVHFEDDIRNVEALTAIFRRYHSDIRLVVHTAAQPSHDWAARSPTTDFSVNALGTLNLLEATRVYAQDAVFIFTSTNKVYGDTPNQFPLLELAKRWEIDPRHTYANGVREDLSIDHTLHSVFGASKVSADVLTQEYGQYFGLRTVCFRGGCLTGPTHAGTMLHGFLAYLMQCTAKGRPYTVMGYKGKQVRDNIHSHDLIRAFHAFFENPRAGEVYNIGGGRGSNCSVLEGIDYCQQITGRELSWHYEPENRIGDHIWWISDFSKFQTHYPSWNLHYDIPMILEEIYESNRDRWQKHMLAQAVVSGEV